MPLTHSIIVKILSVVELLIFDSRFQFLSCTRRLLYTTLCLHINLLPAFGLRSGDWSGSMNQFAIIFEARVPMGGLTANPFTQNL